MMRNGQVSKVRFICYVVIYVTIIDICQQTMSLYGCSHFFFKTSSAIIIFVFLTGTNDEQWKIVHCELRM